MGGWSQSQLTVGERQSTPWTGHTVCSTFQFAVYIILIFCLLFNYSLSLESPVVTVALSDILIGIGETTVMACSASGTPQPEIWWYKGNTFETLKAHCGAKITHQSNYRNNFCVGLSSF